MASETIPPPHYHQDADEVSFPLLSINFGNYFNITTPYNNNNNNNNNNNIVSVPN
ncbi:hypothetical protein Syun_029791 [Stephania yunnanensis]|uniref:Uncharacterized protein n=1 Tax=Stephania yunnanensis TaxID=152371 RepID=A0AAP0E9L3_9MAGN